MGKLRDRHLADLRSSGLTDATIRESGVYSADGATVSRLLGFKSGPGMVIPYPSANGNGKACFRRVKPDDPGNRGSGRPAKYLSAKGDLNPEGNQLYIPPNLDPAVLGDVAESLVVTEGEKKALAGCQEGFPTVALAGVWCWKARGEDGESHPINDLDLVAWVGRDVIIAFDSDGATKPEVKKAALALAEELESRGASVRLARLPKPTAKEDREFDLGGKFGMDDFLRARGRAQFEEILRKANVPSRGQDSRKKVPTADLAEQFLDKTGLRKGESIRLRSWRDEFYRFVGTHYDRISHGDVRARVNVWLQGQPEHRGLAGTRVAAAIIENLQALTLIPETVEPPTWVGDGGDGQEYISLSNGLIAVDDLLHGDLDAIRLHSAEHFALSSLPFPLDPEADCRRWLQVLDENVPDPEVQRAIKEMFGYLLVHDTTMEKFFLLEGQGANGKTVVCTVLREILGPTNVSAVGLEAFSAVRTFPLAATVGKKANIVEELDEIAKAAEGTLKNFVTGKSMTIERKNKDAFEFTPTARLVFATNVLPRFVDRTDGLWRRMVLIPFRNQILDPSKQDRRLIDPAWWRDSGELPAIFLWAVGGLAALRQRDHFEEPEVCRAEKDCYRRDSNPAGTFLQEKCEVVEGAEAPSNILYTAYHDWSKDNGYKPLSHAHFAQEVRRCCPTVTRTEHPQRTHSGRTRVWKGIRMVGDKGVLGE